MIGPFQICLAIVKTFKVWINDPKSRIIHIDKCKRKDILGIRGVFVTRWSRQRKVRGEWRTRSPDIEESMFGYLFFRHSKSSFDCPTFIQQEKMLLQILHGFSFFRDDPNSTWHWLAKICVDWKVAIEGIPLPITELVHSSTTDSFMVKRVGKGRKSECVLMLTNGMVNLLTNMKVSDDNIL